MLRKGTQTHVLNLDGTWKLSRQGLKKRWLAQVPGTVHEDLIRSGAIPDPYPRLKELDVQWVGIATWIYKREFTMTPEILKEELCELVFDGLDTLAEVRLNGQFIGKADNMYRAWRFDVLKLLQPGRNTLEVTFLPALAEMERKADEYAANGRSLIVWGSAPWEPKISRGILRKMPCNFGWDWGPALTTSGIWQSVRIETWSTPRLQEVLVLQEHSRNLCGIKVQARLRGEVQTTGLLLHAELSLDGKKQILAESTLSGLEGTLSLKVKNPRLWWPNGMGAQPLYKLKVELRNIHGQVIDTWVKKIGLRTLRLVRNPDKRGESFHFEANGKPFFAKGANWIPADAIYSRVGLPQYELLLKASAAAHMNMIRIWGGGHYERDEFYDLCDELGLCVWQEFMFACVHIPLFDQKFIENFRQEAIEQVQRIRHHASLTLWCGNNEFEMGGVKDNDDLCMRWSEYKPLFDELNSQILGSHAPQCDYWPSSPHTPHGNRSDFNNPDCGDAHLWDVWHGGQPFEWYRTATHRFCSEFGFQAFPHPETVAAYANEDEKNLTTQVMEHHQRSKSGNSSILRYMLDWFRMPVGSDNVIWASQLLQGLAIQYAVENWRRRMPECMGALYWQLNDCWPVASWASIDYFGRWKALHYFARRFFDPLLLSAVENMETGTVEVHITNDRDIPVRGKVDWWLTDTDGKILKKGMLPAKIKAGSTGKVGVLDLRKELDHHGASRLLVWLKLTDAEGNTRRTLATFTKPKHLDLPQKPGLKARIDKDRTRKEWCIRLTVKKPALYAWVDLAGEKTPFSDNFIHLRPGEPVELRIRISGDLSRKAVERKLTVRSLVDLEVVP